MTRRVSDRLLCFVVPLLFLLLFASQASAQINTWNLSGVTFDDSTTASGFITYNFGTSTVTNWSVSVQASPSFTARTYDPGNSTVSVDDTGNTQLTITLQESPAPGSGQRQFRITPVSALDGTLTTVPVNLATIGNGSGAVECFNCGPFREIVAGSFTIGPAVPTMSGPLLIGLTALLMATGSWMLVRRRSLALAGASVSPRDAREENALRRRLSRLMRGRSGPNHQPRR